MTSLFLSIVVVNCFLTTTLGGYADNGPSGSSGSGSTSGSTGGGSGYGYSFSNAGSGAGAGGNIPPFDFNNFLAGVFATVYVHPSFKGKVTAHASVTIDGFNQLQNQAGGPGMNPIDLGSRFAGGYGFPGGFPGFSGFPNPGSADSISFPGASHSSHTPDVAAGASAVVGGGKIEQTAFLSPENPNSPNIQTRFASAPQDGGSGTYGVFTSSSSGSQTGPDGKTTHFRTAETTVNENGKVTTYKLQD